MICLVIVVTLIVVVGSASNEIQDFSSYFAIDPFSLDIYDITAQKEVTASKYYSFLVRSSSTFDVSHETKNTSYGTHRQRISNGINNLIFQSSLTIANTSINISRNLTYSCAKTTILSNFQIEMSECNLRRYYYKYEGSVENIIEYFCSSITTCPICPTCDCRCGIKTKHIVYNDGTSNHLLLKQADSTYVHLNTFDGGNAIRTVSSWNNIFSANSTFVRFLKREYVGKK